MSMDIAISTKGKWKVFAEIVIDRDTLSVSRVSPSAYARTMTFSDFAGRLASIPHETLADLASGDIRSKLGKNTRVGDVRLTPIKIKF